MASKQQWILCPAPYIYIHTQLCLAVIFGASRKHGTLQVCKCLGIQSWWCSAGAQCVSMHVSISLRVHAAVDFNGMRQNALCHTIGTQETQPHHID